MKILQINSVCGIGSTGRIATDLYHVIEGQGHECVIAYGRGSAPDNIKTIKIGSDIDNYKHVLKTRVLDRHGFGSTNATKEFIKRIEEYNPDVIHLHNIHGYYVNIELLFNYLKSANKPVVWTLHDCWGFTGHCSYFDYVNCDKWKTECFNCPQKSQYPSSILIDNSRINYLNKKDTFTGVKDLTIVTPSNWLSELVKKSILREYPITIINNGIDLNIFKPTKSEFRDNLSLNNKTIILGVASVWEERKGLKFLKQLSNELDSNYKVIVVGVTERQKSQLPTNIIGITRTNNIKELAEIYFSADIFVNPTLEDNFPTTNLEALACGTPVITFNTGGSPECIDKNCGFIVEKENIDGLIKAVKEIKDNKKEKYKQYCIDRARQFYDKDKKYEEYLNLYYTRWMCKDVISWNTI